MRPVERFNTTILFIDLSQNGDGAVAFSDFLILSANFGNTRPQVVAAISSEESPFKNVPAPSDADVFFERFDDGLTVDELL